MSHIIFGISCLSWIIFWILVYTHFHNILPNPIINYITQKIPNYDTIHPNQKISFITSMTHAILSLLTSLYLLTITPRHLILEQNIYHITTAISITYYYVDLIMVGYYTPDLMFFIHHVMANVLLITFYIYAHYYPIIFPFGMMLAEITNPIQLTFSYLKHTKQQNTNVFYMISTILTYVFTFMRCLVIPIAYVELYYKFYIHCQLSGIHNYLYHIALFAGLIGSLLWCYSMVLGYWKKMFLKLVN